MSFETPIQVVIPNLAQVAKGVVLQKVYGKSLGNTSQLDIKTEKINLSELEDFLGKSVLSDLTLIHEGKEIVLKDCVMNVAMENNIVQTAVAGRSGTVKEFIAEGDFTIQVSAGIGANGFVFSEFLNNQDHYPLSEMNAILKVLRAKETIGVSSDFLRIFKIESVVIKNVSINQETEKNIQSISFDMLSDEPYEIKLKNDA